LTMLLQRHMTRFALCAIGIATLLVSAPIFAQEQQTSPSQQQQSGQPSSNQAPAGTSATDQSQAPAQTETEKKEIEQEQKTGTSNDRLFFALPNFLTVSGSEPIPPLTAKQKFKIVARGSFDYSEYPWYAIIAGVGQASNSDPSYGQGMEGYGKRYAAAFADGTIENFMAGAVFPSLLRQDPRYYQLGKGGFWHRAGYAMSRIIITRGDSGNREFNFSEILGNGASASIGTYTYHSASDRNISGLGSAWGTQIGYDTITILLKEFWPDIRRHIHK
jgi:hypothetical protein